MREHKETKKLLQFPRIGQLPVASYTFNVKVGDSMITLERIYGDAQYEEGPAGCDFFGREQQVHLLTPTQFRVQNLEHLLTRVVGLHRCAPLYVTTPSHLYVPATTHAWLRRRHPTCDLLRDTDRFGELVLVDELSFADVQKYEDAYPDAMIAGIRARRHVITLGTYDNEYNAKDRLLDAWLGSYDEPLLDALLATAPAEKISPHAHALLATMAQIFATAPTPAHDERK